jgi:hypothetical protein
MAGSVTVMARRKSPSRVRADISRCQEAAVRERRLWVVCSLSLRKLPTLSIAVFNALSHPMLNRIRFPNDCPPGEFDAPWPVEPELVDALPKHCTWSGCERFCDSIRIIVGRHRIALLVIDSAILS